MLFIIEHLEPKLSEWLLIEYSHAAEIAGRKNILITNVKKKSEREKLSRVCRVEEKSVSEIFPQSELVVLDPQARRKLSPRDLKKVVVVGGILGDDPPQGRTRGMLTKFLPGAAPRNIGVHQFAIDGTIHVVKQVRRGVRLEDIPTKGDIEVPIAKNLSIILPFAYPLVKGQPLISGKLVHYLKRRGAVF